jgi:hypothetical protein
MLIFVRRYITKRLKCLPPREIVSFVFSLGKTKQTISLEFSLRKTKQTISLEFSLGKTKQTISLGSKHSVYNIAFVNSER